MRGGLEYKRPCGWRRYALKVDDKYGDCKCQDVKEIQIIIQNGYFLNWFNSILKNYFMSFMSHWVLKDWCKSFRS